MTRRSHGQSSKAEHEEYFQKQLHSTVEFWRRFDRRPDFQNKSVLDFGCGHGAMSIDAARAGATALGIDLDVDRVTFARDNVSKHYPEISERVEFRDVDLVNTPDPTLANTFDIVLSKDTFEHVDDVEAMLVAISDLLKPDGELWAGFSPLYWSPRGDHGRTGLKVPWMHATMPASIVLMAASRFNNKPVRGLSDIGLNGMTSPEFFTYAQNAGFRVETLLFNQGDKPLMRLFGEIRRVAILERYFTIGIYTVMRKPS
jgi:SAM-dependent methyltransferase